MPRAVSRIDLPVEGCQGGHMTHSTLLNRYSTRKWPYLSPKKTIFDYGRMRVHIATLTGGGGVRGMPQ